MTLSAVNPNNPAWTIETHPSQFTGFAWWVVLRYKEHEWQEMLPQDFPAIQDHDENAANLLVQERLSRMMPKVREVILAEDAAG